MICQGSILALHVPSTMETFAPSSASRAFSSLRRSPRTSGSRCVRPCPPRRWRSWRERTMKRPPAWPRRRAPAPTAPSQKKMEKMERLRVQQVVVPMPSSWSKLWWKRLIIWRLRWKNCKSEVAPVRACQVCHKRTCVFLFSRFKDNRAVKFMKAQGFMKISPCDGLLWERFDALRTWTKMRKSWCSYDWGAFIDHLQRTRHHLISLDPVFMFSFRVLSVVVSCRRSFLQAKQECDWETELAASVARPSSTVGLSRICARRNCRRRLWHY